MHTYVFIVLIPSSFLYRVPLLPRRLLPEPTEEKTPKKKGGPAAAFTPPPPVEDLTGLSLDDQLVVHAYNSAISFVFTSVSAGQGTMIRTGS